MRTTVNLQRRFTVVSSTFTVLKILSLTGYQFDINVLILGIEIFCFLLIVMTRSVRLLVLPTIDCSFVFFVFLQCVPSESDKLVA